MECNIYRLHNKEGKVIGLKRVVTEYYHFADVHTRWVFGPPEHDPDKTIKLTSPPKFVMNAPRPRFDLKDRDKKDG